MRFLTDGIVVRERNIGESDRLVSVLTRDRGLISAFATGAKSLKSATGSATSLLAYSSLAFFRSRDTYRVREAEAKDIFFEIRTDIESFSLAGYFCELMLNFAPAEEPAEDFLRLMLAGLHALRKGRDKALVKAAFELRLCALAGYMPDLFGCRLCGDEAARPMYFDPREGQMLCPRCAERHGYPPRVLSGGVLSAARHAAAAPLERLFAFRLAEDEKRAFAAAAEEYLLLRAERNFKTLQFYKSLF